MKIKQGFILHRIGDDYIIMQDGSSNVDFSKVISLEPNFRHALARDRKQRVRYRQRDRSPDQPL